MGEIIEVSILMWIVAVAAFAPLGYFIYIFMKSGGESFGKSNPADHSVENTKYYHVINNIMGKILGGSTASSSGKPASSQSAASAAAATNVSAATSAGAANQLSTAGAKRAPTARKTASTRRTAAGTTRRRPSTAPKS